MNQLSLWIARGGKFGRHGVADVEEIVGGVAEGLRWEVPEKIRFWG
jgi:hypothetical protein